MAEKGIREDYCNYVGNITELGDIVEKASELWHDKIAFIHKEREITYKRFRDDVVRMEKLLAQKGLRKGDMAALVSENSYEWIVVYFAVIGTGGVIVPIDAELPAEKIGGLISGNNIRKLICSEKYKGIAENSDAECFEIGCLYTEASGIDAASPFVKSYDHNADDICQISFTSGTTGKMKAVMLSQRNLIADALGGSKNINAPREQRLLVMLPFNHMFTLVASLIIPIMRCTKMYISAGRKYFLRELMMFRPQWLVVVPAVAKTLIKVASSAAAGGDPATAAVLKELGIIVCGGAALEKEYVYALGQAGIVLVNGYGITECAPVVAVNYPDHNVPGSCGVTIDGCEVKISEPDEEGTGEIYIRGDNVFKGYLDAEDNEGVFDGEWFRSGDIGRYEDGILYITGRKKNLIILENGKNVSAEWLESLLSKSIPVIEEVVVRGENDLITAEIYSPGNEEVVRESIKEVNKKLSGYQQIKKVVFRDDPFEKTATLKILRI